MVESPDDAIMRLNKAIRIKNAKIEVSTAESYVTQDATPRGLMLKCSLIVKY